MMVVAVQDGNLFLTTMLQLAVLQQPALAMFWLTSQTSRST